MLIGYPLVTNFNSGILLQFAIYYHNGTGGSTATQSVTKPMASTDICMLISNQKGTTSYHMYQGWIADKNTTWSCGKWPTQTNFNGTAENTFQILTIGY